MNTDTGQILDVEPKTGSKFNSNRFPHTSIFFPHVSAYYEMIK